MLELTELVSRAELLREMRSSENRRDLTMISEQTGARQVREPFFGKQSFAAGDDSAGQTRVDGVTPVAW